MVMSDGSAGEATLRIDVFTLFPALVDGFCSESLLGKARGTGLVDLRLHDPRDHTADVHRTVDDSPFGGGAGMLMRPEPTLRLGRSGRSAAALVPARPRWPPIRSADGARTGRIRRVQSVVRAIRRCRPSGSAASRGRRTQRRRCCAQRGRGRSVPGDRGRHPPAPRGDGQRRQPGRRELRRFRPARGAPFHPAGRLPRLGSARGSS